MLYLLCGLRIILNSCTPPNDPQSEPVRTSGNSPVPGLTVAVEDGEVVLHVVGHGALHQVGVLALLLFELLVEVGPRALREELLHDREVGAHGAERLVETRRLCNEGDVRVRLEYRILLTRLETAGLNGVKTT